jgi:hypothetical protein
MNSEPLDQIPLWLLLPLIVGLSLTMMEVGYRLGRWRHSRFADEKESPVAAMSTAVLGLLAFMLAFTFSMAATRFDARRHTVVEEVNAIGTTYLRARLLPEPQRSIITSQLIRYTEVRSQKLTPDNILEVLDQSVVLHQEVWTQIVAVAEKDTRSVMTGLFIESLNQVIDLHSKRVFVGLYNRIPITIWASLWFLIVLGMASFGYQAGIAATTRSLVMPIFALAFAGVLYLIFDLDRSHEGLLQISQQAMADLYSSMLATNPNR